MTATGGKRVIGIGLACLDQLLIWEDMAAPVQDNKIVNTDMQGGGMAATAMVAVSRLGGQAELWAAVGDDWVGQQIVRSLETERVDVGQVVRTVGGRSMLMLVCVDHKTGERHFMHWNAPDKPTRAIGDLAHLADAGCLLIDHTLPASELRAAQEAQRLGVPVVSDTERLDKSCPEIFPFVDYAIVSERGARALNDDLREACRSIQQMGAGCVVVTLGEQGLVYLHGATYGRLPAFEVEAVDTTGAGDVFHGAFCYGLVQGFPLERNLRFASATSALKCLRIGGRAGIPSRGQVDEFLREKGIDRVTG